MFVSKVFPEVSSESKYSIGCLVIYFMRGEWRIKKNENNPLRRPWLRPWENTLEIFLNKPKKKDESTDVCLVPMVYSKVSSKVFAEVSAESKYSIGCLVIYFMLGEWRIKYE